MTIEEKSVVTVNLTKEDVKRICDLMDQLVDTFGIDINVEDAGEFIFSIYHQMPSTFIKDFEVNFNYED